jgi:hypothetical protein
VRAVTWGHGKKSAYIDLAVEGMAGLRAFADRLNLVDRRIRDEAFFDVSLNWSEEVVTSCAFDLFPRLDHALVDDRRCRPRRIAVGGNLGQHCQGVQGSVEGSGTTANPSSSPRVVVIRRGDPQQD